LVSITWGFFVLTMLSYILAKAQQKKPWKIILEHLLIVIIVIAITHYLGDWVANIGKSKI